MSGDFHSLCFDSARCDGCMACMRVCPTAAIRVRAGRARMLEDRCIDCDECLRVCPKRAILPLTHTMNDLTRYDYKIAIPSPTLYGQFSRTYSPGGVLNALRLCGFEGVVPESAACDAVTHATRVFLSRYDGPRPMISSFCPVVVRLVQVKYPSLLPQLLPVLAPREVAARDAKEAFAKETGLSPDRVGAFYITPCSAKMVAIREHPGMSRSYLDGAVAIRDLFQPLLSALSRGVTGEAEAAETASGVSWACAGAVPGSLPKESTLVVAGLHNLIRILDDIEKGRLQRYAFVEGHACLEGCVGGTLTVENPYVARTRIIEWARSLPAEPAVGFAEVERRYEAQAFAMSSSWTARPPRPVDEDVTRAIYKMKERDRISAGLRGIDCGACGSPTCRAFAEDVALGEANEKDCPFVREREVAALVSRLHMLVGGIAGSAVVEGGEP